VGKLCDIIELSMDCYLYVYEVDDRELLVDRRVLSHLYSSDSHMIMFVCCTGRTNISYGILITIIWNHSDC